MAVWNLHFQVRRCFSGVFSLRVITILFVCLITSRGDAQEQRLGLMIGARHDSLGSGQSGEASHSDDAETFAETLRELEFSVEYSKEDEAERRMVWTHQAISDRVSDLANRATLDTEIVVLSLHGWGSAQGQKNDNLHAYFRAVASTPVDASEVRSSDSEHLIAVEELYELLSQSRAKAKMMVLDITCKDHSSCAKFQAAVSFAVNRLRGDNDTVVFCSCVLEESAVETGETHFIGQLKRGIQGSADSGDKLLPRDGVVTLSELQAHMRSLAAAPQDTLNSTSLQILGNPDLQSNVSKVPSAPLAAGLEMVHIPAGMIRRGSRMLLSPTEQPVRTITISHPFYVAKYELTISQALRWLNDPQVVFDKNWINVDDVYCPIQLTNGIFVKNSNSKSDRLPVFDLSWEGAVAFCEWCNRQDKSFSYRLPTEAEWEYMARAGSVSEFPFGDSCNGINANIDGTQPFGTTETGPQRPHTTEVGSFAPNAWGVYDTVGNVSEWCEDLYDLEYYRDSPTRDPLSRSGIARLRRGGSFTSAAVDARSSFRNAEVRHLLRIADGIGARVVAVRNPK